METILIHDANIWNLHMTAVERSVTQETPGDIARRLAARYEISPDKLRDHLAGVLGNGVSARISPEKKQELLDQCAEDPFIAYAEYIDILQAETPVPKSAASASRRTDRRLRALMSTDKILIQEQTPATFVAGSSGHSMIEEVFAARSIEQLPTLPFKLAFSEDGQVIGAKLQPETQGVQQMQLLASTDEQLPESPLLEINFEVPLPPPEPGESRSLWLVRVYQENLDSIQHIHGRLPTSPHEVDQLLARRMSREAVERLLGASHLMFGPRPGMSCISHDGKTFDLAGINEFGILNSFATIRATIDRVHELLTSPRLIDNSALLQELSLDDLAIVNGSGEPFLAKGGRADLLLIRMKGEEDEIVESHETGKGIEQITSVIEGVFKSQSTRYRRKSVPLSQQTFKTDIPIGSESPRQGNSIEVNTRLPRNLTAYFKRLSDHYGDEMFDRIVLQFQDFKFPGGDNGRDTVWEESALPIEDHKSQLSEYLFWSSAQLLRTKKWKDGEGEKHVVTAEEVLDFIRAHGLHQRFTAVLRYQMPHREAQFEVSMPDPYDEPPAASWAHAIIHARASKAKRYKETLYLRGFEQMLGSENEPIKLERRRPPQIPDEFRHFCAEYHGKVHFFMDQFVNWFASKENSELQVREAVYFSDQDIYVMWTDGPQRWRMAFNGKGEFSVKDEIGTANLRGFLATSVTKRNVTETEAKLMTSFTSRIWDPLKRTDIAKETEDWITPDSVWWPDGTIRARVPGKPNVCRQDLMTGTFTIDKNLLEEALGIIAGHRDWGFPQIADLMSSRSLKEKEVFCPLPTHANVHTQAAHYYGNDRHIHCFSECGCNVFFPHNKEDAKGERKLFVPGLHPEEYVRVSDDRRHDVELLLHLSQAFDTHTNLGNEYLASRGLNPDDVGPFGTFPREVSEALDAIVRNKYFWKVSKGARSYRLDQVRALVVRDQSAVESAEEELQRYELEQSIDSVLSSISGIFWDDRMNQDTVINALTPGALANFERRGILGSHEGYTRIGGRIIFPTYWVDKGPDGLQFCVANYQARIIRQNGEDLVGGNKYLKAYINQKPKPRADGTYPQPTPSGVWMRNPKASLLAIEDTVVITEGLLNAAAFGRIRPDLGFACAAAGGLHIRNIIAFLRALGVEADPNPAQNDFGKHIRRVYLALDPDEAGDKVYARNETMLMQQFPGLKVESVWSLIPREYNGVKEKLESDYEAFGKKWDLNDLYLNGQW